MKNTNWRAMQVPPHVEQGKPPVWQRPVGIKPKYMCGGAWHADARSHGAKRPR